MEYRAPRIIAFAWN